MSNSKIEWTDKTWNPVTGCTKVSQGCKNCYAERLYERFHGHNSFKQVICHEDRLSIPLKWRKPAMVFVNSMSDLFHEDVPFIFIDAVFRVMADQNQHIYQVLTKRPKRMLEFYKWKFEEFSFPWRASKNVRIGVSIEDQNTADERIPLLLEVPSRILFLSCEPMLGPICLTAIGHGDQRGFNALTGETRYYREDNGDPASYWGRSISWVICGGESGPKARAVREEWVRGLRDQCEQEEVPFFFKQWGEYIPFRQGRPEHRIHKALSWPDPENPTYHLSFYKLGKGNTGRVLDGKEHNGMPNDGVDRSSVPY